MRVGIFVVFIGREYGGPQTYEQRIASEVARLDPENEYFIYSPEPGAAAAYEGLTPNASCRVLGPRIRWLSIPLTLPYRLVRDRVDLLHATVVPPPFSPRPTVFTMHDVTPFAFPEFYPAAITMRLRALMRRGVMSSRLVICVSRNAMETTMEHFKLGADRFVVIHHGVNPEFRPVPRERAREDVAKALGLAAPYILHVGHVEKRKNVGRLLEAFHILRLETRFDVKLAFSGIRNFDTAFVDEILDRLRLRKHVIELGEVPGHLMPAVYSAAEMLSFPSLWEGFGFPVLEAMACGTPVVTANVSSLPEIAGDAALLVDPTRVEDIAAAMCRVIADSQLRAELGVKGRARAAMFTWERAAKATIQAYKRVISR